MSRAVSGFLAGFCIGMDTVMGAMGDQDDDALLAVVAHSLLGSMSVVVGAVETVDQHWDRLGEDTRRQLLKDASVQARYVSDVLRDLLRGLPPEVIAVLDSLERRDATEN
jgi:hypothetical protein